MTDRATPNDGHETLGAFLAGYARSRTDRRLLMDAVLGLLLAALAPVFRPPAWPALLGAATALGALGLWGIFDRELSERLARGSSERVRALRTGRITAVVLGALGGTLVILSILAIALGTWIS